MKRLILTFAILGFIATDEATAQVVMQRGGDMLTFSKRDDSPEVTAGSQYINDRFLSARVNEGTDLFRIRFNPYLGIMEYDKDGEIYHLTKDVNTVVEFVGSNSVTYKLYKYTDNDTEHTEYMKVVFEGEKIAFQTLEKVILKPGKTATNSYESSSQPEYKRDSDKRFMTINGKTQEFSTRTNRFIKMFDKSIQNNLKDYIKDNRIDLDKDADLVKLGRHLDGLL
ncbi:hypothetical protein [Avrilella dinanensis]|uniref:Uncharacterized protein n=1 Tax=Avrilella dinanensis TaxID=2008672 RepID=A0A2M9R7F5_9FLAO|nr:hypothetical protein [Avrilella dinanensis]PJR04792.1 hypothetical protein CDL10_09760 [Avrilella dinanensis]